MYAELCGIHPQFEFISGSVDNREEKKILKINAKGKIITYPLIG